MNQAALAIDAVPAGQGVAMVNRCFVREALERRQLLQVLDEPVQSDWGYYLVMPTRNRADVAPQAVAHWLKTLASDSATSG